MNSCDVVCIDEIQFIKNAEMCEYIATTLDKIVIVSGLNSDYKKRPFEEIMKLIPVADSITKLSAVCS